MVDRPPRRREHQVARLPLIAATIDDAATAAMEVVVDRGRDVAMRSVDDPWRTDCDRREEVRRRAVRPTSHRVVEEIQPPPSVSLAERGELVETLLHFHPWPMQGRRG